MQCSRAPVILSLLGVAAEYLHASPTCPSLAASSLPLPIRLSQQQSNLTAPSPPKVDCFDPDGDVSYPLFPPLCAVAVDSIITRDDPDTFMQRQVFYKGPNPPKAAHLIPETWPVEDGFNNCAVALLSVHDEDRDEFALSDVAVAAQRVIQQCAEGGKRPVGGLLTVGPRRVFFVAVNGIKDELNLDGNVTELYYGRLESGKVETL